MAIGVQVITQWLKVRLDGPGKFFFQGPSKTELQFYFTEFRQRQGTDALADGSQL